MASRGATLAWLCWLLALLGRAMCIEVAVSVPSGQKKCYGEQAASTELLVIEFEAQRT